MSISREAIRYSSKHLSTIETITGILQINVDVSIDIRIVDVPYARRAAKDNIEDALNGVLYGEIIDKIKAIRRYMIYTEQIDICTLKEMLNELQDAARIQP